MFREFREFIKRGNVMDLAVGVIIGAAFGKIVASFTDDLIMPFLSLFTGKVDFSNWFLALNGQRYDTIAEAKKATAVIAYGSVLNAIINFLIIAFVIFLLVKWVNRILPPTPAAPAGPPPTEVLLTEIRDLLKKRA